MKSPSPFDIHRQCIVNAPSVGRIGTPLSEMGARALHPGSSRISKVWIGRPVPTHGEGHHVPVRRLHGVVHRMIHGERGPGSRRDGTAAGLRRIAITARSRGRG